MAARSSSSSSSLNHKTTGEGIIQICCSWGNQIAYGILLTYRIIDGGNSQTVKIMHQAIDEWNYSYIYNGSWKFNWLI